MKQLKKLFLHNYTKKIVFTKYYNVIILFY